MPTEAFFNLELHKKNQLLESAIHEFSTQPYEKVSVFKMAQKAGVSRSGFYYYFSDKEDIYKYLINQIKDEIMASLSGSSVKYDMFTFTKIIFQEVASIKGTPREEFIKKVVENMKSSDTKEFFEEVDCNDKEEDYHYLCNFDDLKFTSPEELKNLFTLLISGTTYRLIQYFEEKESLKEAETQLEQMFDIIRYGVLK